MAEEVAQIITVYSNRLGHLKTGASETNLKPGLLCKLMSGGSTVDRASPTAALGVAYGHRYAEYAPTTKTFAADEPLTVVVGDGEALLSSDFFVGGSLPAAGDLLYSQANGLWGMQGSNKVGRCMEVVTRIEPVAGVGQSQNLAHIQFNIQP